MNKKIAIIISCILVVAVVFTGLVFAFADKENNMDIPHDHEYQITGFQNGTATLTCEVCEDSYTDAFVNHINEQGSNVFDANEDGFVNMRDYSILIQSDN